MSDTPNRGGPANDGTASAGDNIVTKGSKQSGTSRSRAQSKSIPSKPNPPSSNGREGVQSEASDDDEFISVPQSIPDEDTMEPEGETAASILGSIVSESKHDMKEGPVGADSEKQVEGSQEFVDESAEGALANEMQSTLSFLSDASFAAGAAGGTKRADGWGTTEGLTRFKEEYDKIHKLLLQSRKNEQALIRKCKDLTNELGANAAKVQAALRLSQNDRSTISALKKEVKKAWKMVEATGEKEARSADAISRLKLEIEGLKKQIVESGNDVAPVVGGSSVPASGAVVSGGYNRLIENQMLQEETILQLSKERDEAMTQIVTISASKLELERELQDLKERNQDLLDERSQTERNLDTLKDMLAKKKSEQDREAQLREKLETNLKALATENSRRDVEAAVKSAEIAKLKELLTRAETFARDEKDRLAKEMKDREVIQAKLKHVEKEYEDQLLDNTKMLASVQQQALELKSWEDELNNYKEDFRSMSRMKDAMQKKIKLLEEGKIEAELERNQLRSINHSLVHDHEGIQKHLDSILKQNENLTRERDIAQKNFVKATGATQRQLNLMKLAEQTKRNLEQEIMAYKDEAAKMRKVIYSLEKDRDRHINEASKLDQELVATRESLKIHEMMLFDARKKIGDYEKKLKEQQSLYENVRADRNLYSKNLVESQDEITDMKRKIKIMNHQVEQLKEEIFSKEAAIAKGHFEHLKLEKDKEGLVATISKLQQQLEEAQQNIQNHIAEENKLQHIIAEADTQLLRQKKENEAVVQERDILGTQLIRRNDELSLLYEKIKIQTSTLNKGEIQYRERLEDLRVLRLEIRKLRREKAILQTETQNVERLRQEIFGLQRDIMRERTRVKVLEEELESPMNIHRWRKLSGSDPSTYELITKVQALQKRLIAKTEEVVEKELIIAHKERLYHEVREVLRRQPGPEVVDELRAVRDAFRAKVRECKALASELNMHHTRAVEFKYELERMAKDQQDLKKRYYKSRQQQQQQATQSKQQRAMSANPKLQCVSGGGVTSQSAKWLGNGQHHQNHMVGTADIAHQAGFDDEKMSWLPSVDKAESTTNDAAPLMQFEKLPRVGTGKTMSTFTNVSNGSQTKSLKISRPKTASAHKSSPAAPALKNSSTIFVPNIAEEGGKDKGGVVAVDKDVIMSGKVEGWNTHEHQDDTQQELPELK